MGERRGWFFVSGEWHGVGEHRRPSRRLKRPFGRSVRPWAKLHVEIVRRSRAVPRNDPDASTALRLTSPRNPESLACTTSDEIAPQAVARDNSRPARLARTTADARRSPERTRSLHEPPAATVRPPDARPSTSLPRCTHARRRRLHRRTTSGRPHTATSLCARGRRTRHDNFGGRAISSPSPRGGIVRVRGETRSSSARERREGSTEGRDPMRRRRRLLGYRTRGHWTTGPRRDSRIHCPGLPTTRRTRRARRRRRKPSLNFGQNTPISLVAFSRTSRNSRARHGDGGDWQPRCTAPARWRSGPRRARTRRARPDFARARALGRPDGMFSFQRPRPPTDRPRALVPARISALPPSPDVSPPLRRR